MSEVQALRLKKHLILGLAGWLNGILLEGRQSRLRTRFVAKLAEGVKMTDYERNEIIGKHVLKEKKGGKEVWKKGAVDNGVEHYMMNPDTLDKFKEEIESLYQEEYVLNVTPETEEMLVLIKDILLNTEWKFGISGEEKTDKERGEKVKQAQEYAEWCDAFESLDI